MSITAEDRSPRLAAASRPRRDPRPVAGSVDELLVGATSREPMKTSDSKSGATFERVVIDGDRYVVKYLHPDDDWIMRVSGDVRCRPALIWQSGLLDAVPESIDPAMVGCAVGLGRNGWGAALLMRDCSELMLPEGDDPVSLEVHLGFIDHMAELHAAMWEWQDDIGLLPVTSRYTEFSPLTHAIEADRPEPEVVPRIVVAGWERFIEIAPQAVRVCRDLADDSEPLRAAMAETPACFLHGDWKMGNLGTHPDGRTVLIDWAVSGRGAPCSELVWYLALNRARLPHAKEDTIAAYRSALERHGVPTAGWWHRQLPLALLGGLVQFGWEKALGDPAELAWWCDRATEGLALL